MPTWCFLEGRTHSLMSLYCDLSPGFVKRSALNKPHRCLALSQPHPPAARGRSQEGTIAEAVAQGPLRVVVEVVSGDLELAQVFGRASPSGVSRSCQCAV